MLSKERSLSMLYSDALFSGVDKGHLEFILREHDGGYKA